MKKASTKRTTHFRDGTSYKTKCGRLPNSDNKTNQVKRATCKACVALMTEEEQDIWHKHQKKMGGTVVNTKALNDFKNCRVRDYEDGTSTVELTQELAEWLGLPFESRKCSVIFDGAEPLEVTND